MRHLATTRAVCATTTRWSTIAGGRNDEAFDNQTVLGIITRQKALNFKPGDENLYSNRRLRPPLGSSSSARRGRRWPGYAKTRIFHPLGHARDAVL